MEEPARDQGRRLAARARQVLRHRATRLLLVGAVLLLVWRVMSGQPSRVEVNYRLGEAAMGLRSLSVRYLLGGEELRRVRFSYSGKRADGVVSHEVLLPDGDYQLVLDMEYEARLPALLRRSRREGAENRVRLLRPLFVRGSGSVAVFVVGDAD